MMYEESGRRRTLRVVAGEGMLIAKVDGSFTDEYGRHEIKAGVTRVAPDHELARRYPEHFRVCWREDLPTARAHRANLRARMDELGGASRAVGKGRTDARPAWWVG
jgi:hypothetical protein